MIPGTWYLFLLLRFSFPFRRSPFSPFFSFFRFSFGSCIAFFAFLCACLLSLMADSVLHPPCAAFEPARVCEFPLRAVFFRSCLFSFFSSLYFLPFFDFDGSFHPFFSYGYYVVSSVFVSPATRWANYMYPDTYIRTLIYDLTFFCLGYKYMICFRYYVQPVACPVTTHFLFVSSLLLSRSTRI